MLNDIITFWYVNFIAGTLVCRSVDNLCLLQSSMFQSDLSSNCFAIESLFLPFYCYLYLNLHKFWWYFGDMFVIIDAIFKTIICSGVRIKKSHKIPCVAYFRVSSFESQYSSSKEYSYKVIFITTLANHD